MVQQRLSGLQRPTRQSPIETNIESYLEVPKEFIYL